MIRRIHVPVLSVGRITLDESQARHAVDVLRLASGTEVEVFDDAGQVATGELLIEDEVDVAVRVNTIEDRTSENANRLEWTIAAAVPKGERADWMVEKLSELGTTAFVPLAAARSVVLPEGKNKRERWMRLATESAKQSRRTGVMRIGELTTVEAMVKEVEASDCVMGWYCSTSDAKSVLLATSALPANVHSIVAFIGPEGGWTDDELARFAKAGFIAVSLTNTVLRVETAAVSAASVIGAVVARRA